MKFIEWVIKTFAVCMYIAFTLITIYLQVFCLSILITSVVALSNIDEFFEDVEDDTYDSDNRDQYRGVARWLLIVAIAGIVVQIVMVIVRALYYVEVITNHFAIFGITVSYNVC